VIPLTGANPAAADSWSRSPGRRVDRRRPQAVLPGAHELALRVTGDRTTGRLLGCSWSGHKGSAVAKRVDIASALFAGRSVDQVSGLDLAYPPPLGSPWDAMQAAARA
jgi:hypothetical protein